jgi:hypothetical protein
MTFRGSFERDIRDFTAQQPEFKQAVDDEDDDAVETMMNERFFNKPEMYYTPGKLVVSYGVPAPTPAFVYGALGKKPLPSREQVVRDAVESVAARFNLRFNEQKWVQATADLITSDPGARQRFMEGDLTVFESGQFNFLGGIDALANFEQREEVFEALRTSPIVRQAMLAEAS